MKEKDHEAHVVIERKVGIEVRRSRKKIRNKRRKRRIDVSVSKID
jgi:hypothetical protein